MMMLEWKLNFEAAHKKWLAWTENNQKLFNLYSSHCMQAMKTKLKGLSEWSAILTAQDGIGLDQLICTIMHRRDKTTPSILDIVQADKRMYLTFQQKDQPITDHLWEFQAVVDVIKLLPGGCPGWSKPVAWVIANEENID